MKSCATFFKHIDELYFLILDYNIDKTKNKIPLYHVIENKHTTDNPPPFSREKNKAKTKLKKRKLNKNIN